VETKLSILEKMKGHNSRGEKVGKSDKKHDLLSSLTLCYISNDMVKPSRNQMWDVQTDMGET
jgi:hypothetical protein